MKYAFINRHKKTWPVGLPCKALGVSRNAVAESFFGSLKQERVQWRHYQTRHEAQQDVLEYISMFYNSQRLHSYLNDRSPNQYEMDMAVMKKVRLSQILCNWQF